MASRSRPTTAATSDFKVRCPQLSGVTFSAYKLEEIPTWQEYALGADL